MFQKFICNGMLGKLCRFLRMCGIDVAYSNKGIRTLLEAKREGRIVLTKNRALSQHEGVFLIQNAQARVQLKEVFEKFDLKGELRLFTRCLVCNDELRKVNKTEIRTKVPYYTYKNFNEFAICPHCERVYWPGSHYAKMVGEIEQILEE